MRLVLPALLLCAGAAHALDRKAYVELISNAEQVVREHMKDPASAQLRGTALYLSGFGAHRVCGEVNAKNSFGGYTGFEAFYLDPEAGELVLQSSTEDPETWAMLYASNCKTRVDP
jgi:hypothetical protein